MKWRYSFILTSSTSYECLHCGQWQRISSFEWLALLHCKMHELKCRRKG